MRLPTRMVAVMTAFAVMSCGDDPTGSGDPLSQAEAFEVFGLLSQVQATAFASALAGPAPSEEMTSAPASVPQPYNSTFNVTAPCSQSGTVSAAMALNGTFDSQTGANAWSYTLTIGYNDCAELLSGGTAITINGAPNIVYTGDFDGSGSSFSFDYSMTGGFSYTSADGRTGTCLISITGSGNSNGSNSISGNICGATFSAST